MAAIGKVSAVFTASTSGLTSGVSSAVSSLRGLESSVNSLRGGMSGLVAVQGAQLFASITSAASQVASSFVSMGKAQAEVIDAQSKLAASTGMTYSELAGLKLAGDLAGVSMESISSAVTKANVAFVRAAEGSQTAIAAFEGIGLSIDQLNGMSTSDRFDAIADAISKLPSEAQKAEAAISLFGRSGAGLLPMFAEGAAGLAKMREESDRLGLGLSNLQGKNVEAMNDAFTRAGAAISGVVTATVANLAPAIEGVTNQLTAFIGMKGGDNIGASIADALLDGAKVLAGIGDTLIANFGSAFEYLSQVGGQWSEVWGIGARVGSALAGVADLLKGVFAIGVGAITVPLEGIVYAVQQMASFAGFDTSGLDQAVAALDGFNQSIGDSFVQGFEDAGKNFKAAVFGDDTAGQAGKAIARPLTDALESGIAAARAAAGQIDVAATTTIEAKVKVDTSSINEAIKGVDSRSREGVEMMFKLMSGRDDSTQERIARSNEEIAANTRQSRDMWVEETDLAPAAGG